jgi:hypothetical protein
MHREKTRRTFAGADDRASERMASDVAIDEKRLLTQLGSLRSSEGVSLEALAFLLGAQPAQLSRHLAGKCGTQLANYLRIARALGYRCEVTFRKVDVDDGTVQTTTDLKAPASKALRSLRR